MTTAPLPADVAARLQVPDDGPVKPLKAGRASTAHLVARRRRLLLTAPFFAASVDRRCTLRARALELHAVEAALVERGVLDVADTVLGVTPEFMPVDRWKAGRRARGLKDHP
jgi:hypothetical protein